MVAAVPDFYWKQHDLQTVIQSTLRDANGAVVDLTAAISVKFLMAATVGGTLKIGSGGTGTAVINSPASAGIVQYQPVTGDTDTVGPFVAEWEVTWPTSRPQTFPNATYLNILITADLG